MIERESFLNVILCFSPIISSSHFLVTDCLEFMIYKSATLGHLSVCNIICITALNVLKIIALVLMLILD